MKDSKLQLYQSACDSIDAILVKEHEKLKGVDDEERRVLFSKVQESATKFSNAISKIKKSTPDGFLEDDYISLYDEIQNYQSWALNRAIQKKYPNAEKEVADIIARCIGVSQDQIHGCLEYNAGLQEFITCMKSKATFFVPE